MPRPLTAREREVLDVMLAGALDNADDLRAQATAATVAGTCDCGCPSIDFAHPPVEAGMHVKVEATIAGSDAWLLLYTQGPWLGGIEYVGIDGPYPAELPPTDSLTPRPN